MAGELTVVHPFDANSLVQKIPGPSHVTVSEEVGDYLIKSKGLDFIHLAKYHDGKPYVFAVIGDLKTWMERHDTEGMVWTSTGKKVQIPEYLFSTTVKIDPFFHVNNPQGNRFTLYPLPLDIGT